MLTGLLRPPTFFTFGVIAMALAVPETSGAEPGLPGDYSDC